MKVYRDVDGKPVLVGECVVELPKGGLAPERIKTRRRLPIPTTGWRTVFEAPALDSIVQDEWAIARVCEVDNTGDYVLNEDVILLRPGDDPARLPGFVRHASKIADVPYDGAAPPPDLFALLAEGIERHAKETAIVAAIRDVARGG